MTGAPISTTAAVPLSECTVGITGTNAPINSTVIATPSARAFRLMNGSMSHLFLAVSRLRALYSKRPHGLLVNVYITSGSIRRYSGSAPHWRTVCSLVSSCSSDSASKSASSGVTNAARPCTMTARSTPS